jgi:hypothetical protein
MTRDVFNWFLSTPFRMPAMSTQTAFGIRAFFGCFKFRYGGDIPEYAQFSTYRYGMALFAIAISYGIAWLVAK